MSPSKSAFIAGIKAISPILLGVIPFAIISGITAVKAGISEMLALFMSIAVFAGAAQLAAAQLIGLHAPVLIIVLTAFIINLRFFMYSASISSYFKSLPFKWRALFAYLLTDQAYAASIIRFNDNNDDEKNNHSFYFGAAITLWIIWQIGTAAGVFLGTKIPESWALDFAVPLTFMALVVPAIKDKASIIAAIAAGFSAVIFADFPYNLNIIISAIIGIMAGFITELINERKTKKK
jgi:4-azaleucine resistance transporter AzlC